VAFLFVRVARRIFLDGIALSTGQYYRVV